MPIDPRAAHIVTWLAANTGKPRSASRGAIRSMVGTPVQARKTASGPPAGRLARQVGHRVVGYRADHVMEFHIDDAGHVVPGFGEEGSEPGADRLCVGRTEPDPLDSQCRQGIEERPAGGLGDCGARILHQGPDPALAVETENEAPGRACEADDAWSDLGEAARRVGDLGR